MTVNFGIINIYLNTKTLNKNPTNKCLFLASVGLTIKRAVLLAPWAGSFLLSSFFVYFFSNGKSMKKKRRISFQMNRISNRYVLFEIVVGAAAL